MTATRHPTAQLRSDYAAANIAPGAALAVAVHLEYCPVCAIGTEAMSGPGETLASDAGGEPIGYLRRAGARPAAAGGEKPLPRPLRGAPLGRWRWLRPGVQVAPIHGVSGFGEAVYLLKAAPGAPAPLAREAVQQLVVLEGGLHAGEETYGPGDFVDASSRPSTPVTARRPCGCLCLMVTDGSWPLFGWEWVRSLWGGYS